eukprot:CAMPEP_0174259598 /NCGR_PEP_ID=MMETSP0439-20130205/8412_1 /TAXON_ID=0 /ORGANISM="Stereomyxa ramosa, Strain Chinc5" /LENGTH=216 /DNA_ID=CAMNT_0015343561 /DNA_START=74 /DNA_END=721 /DNA_ORIENTATION=+
MQGSVSTVDDVAKFYEEQAEKYADSMTSEMGKRLYNEILDGFVEKCREEGKATTIVDVGCGSGDCMRKIKEKEKEKVECIGVDISPKMLEVAKGKGGNLTYHLANADELDFLEEGSVSGVLCYFVVHHFDEGMAERCFKEWYRVLRGGGSVLLGCWCGDDGALMDYGSHSSLRAITWSQEKVTTLLSEAGFRVCSCELEPEPDLGLLMLFVVASKP